MKQDEEASSSPSLSGTHFDSEIDTLSSAELMALGKQMGQEAIKQTLALREIVAQRTLLGGDDPISGLMGTLEEIDPNWTLKPILLSLFSEAALRNIISREVEHWIEDKDISPEEAIEERLARVREVAEQYNRKPLY